MGEATQGGERAMPPKIFLWGRLLYVLTRTFRNTKGLARFHLSLRKALVTIEIKYNKCQSQRILSPVRFRRKCSPNTWKILVPPLVWNCHRTNSQHYVPPVCFRSTPKGAKSKDIRGECKNSFEVSQRPTIVWL